jgi:hypothetical protein
MKTRLLGILTLSIGCIGISLYAILTMPFYVDGMFASYVLVINLALLVDTIEKRIKS